MRPDRFQGEEMFQLIRPDVAAGVYGRTFLAEPVRVTLTRITPGGGFVPHVDDFSHIFTFLSGEGNLTLDGKTERIVPGMIRVTPAGAEHAIENDQMEDLRLLTCNLPEGYSLDVPLNNLFSDLPEAAADEQFEQLYTTENFLIERIVSHGHTTPPDTWYNQKRDEWVFLLSGGARLTFPDAEPCTLCPGDHVSLPAGMRHRVDWTEPDVDSVWLALHYTSPSTPYL